MKLGKNSKLGKNTQFWMKSRGEIGTMMSTLVYHGVEFGRISNELQRSSLRIHGGH
jgi:hypothetical protein